METTKGMESENTLEPEVTGLVARVSELLVVQTGDQYEALATAVLDVDAMVKKIHEVLDPDINRAWELHRSMTGTRNKLTTPLTGMRDSGRRALGRYDYDQQLKAKMAAPKLRAEMTTVANEERIEVAAALEVAGLKEEAEGILAAPNIPVVVDVQPDVRKVAGVSTRVPYAFRIINRELIPDQYWVLDEKALGAVARSLGERAAVPGVEFYPDPKASLRQPRG